MFGFVEHFLERTFEVGSPKVLGGLFSLSLFIVLCSVSILYHRL